VQVLGPCASLSLLGRNLRGILHELGAAFELFEDCNIHLVSQAANDLNFTFVIDESAGDRLVRQLHERLIQRIGSDDVLGPTWAELFAAVQPLAATAGAWWRAPAKRAQLLEIGAREGAAYVYDLASVDAAAAALRGVRAVDRWAYAMKANWHPAILRRLHAGVCFPRRARPRLRECRGPAAATGAVHAELRAARRVRGGLCPRRAAHAR
jgi:diaminopimelate decarboxylase/aspartate kinase